MRSSSFLGGVLLGALASNWMSKRNMNWMSVVGQAGSLLNLGDMARNKSRNHFPSGGGNQSFKGNEAQSISGNASSTQHSSHSHSTTETSHKTHDSKDSNLRMIREFIKGNPEVRIEVDKILKETNTVIPGL